MPPKDPHSLEEDYDTFPQIEEEFQNALDESLNPRGPDFLYAVVAGLGLPPGTSVLDLGCGTGRQSIQLAERFGFAVLGVDPVPRNIEWANEAAESHPDLARLVRFEQGSTDSIPAPDASVDLIWCREVLVLVTDLDRAFAECRRVLRRGGRMLLYQMFSTDPLTYPDPGWDAKKVEAAFTATGFQVAERIDLTSEWGEFAQEDRGDGGRRLVHIARLLRDPERYIAKFGQASYDIMLADCFWHVYRMIGKLSARVYLLKIT